MTQTQKGFRPALLFALVLPAILVGLVLGVWWVTRTGPLAPVQVRIVNTIPSPVVLTPPALPPPITFPQTAPAPSSVEAVPSSLAPSAPSSPSSLPPAPAIGTQALPKSGVFSDLPPPPVSGLAPRPRQASLPPFDPSPPPTRSGNALSDYAMPFDLSDPRPRIALIIGDVGLSAAAGRAVIDRMPIAVTIAFAPSIDNLQNWIDEARRKGHETILQLPAERGAEANMARLGWLLDKASGYVGMTDYMASADYGAEDVEKISSVLKRIGAMFVASGVHAEDRLALLAQNAALLRAANSRFIDNQAAQPAIDARLDELERIAKETGRAVGFGYPYPVTIERVVAWAAGLSAKGIALAPVSAMVR